MQELVQGLTERPGPNPLKQQTRRLSIFLPYNPLLQPYTVDMNDQRTRKRVSIRNEDIRLKLNFVYNLIGNQDDTHKLHERLVGSPLSWLIREE